jgi:creatinine amidohydrolase
MIPFKLADANLTQVRSAGYQVAVLPLGAIEPHNLHLPYGTDWFEANLLGERVCRYAAERGAAVALLPAIPYGTETNLREFPLAINLNPSTLARVVSDVVDSLATSGIHKLVLLNSHGGNELKPVLRELYGRTPVHLFLCNWYLAIRDVAERLLSGPDDHAGEMETSLALAYFPDLVARTSGGGLAADDGSTRSFRFAALQAGWVSITRPWHLLTTNSGAGNPHAATAEKGRELVRVVEERIGQFLVELAGSPLDSMFPFQA